MSWIAGSCVVNDGTQVKVIFLMGPTASGKSGLALRLAERFPLEIVSVDSASVYRDMNIGTAKPSPEVLSAFPHHLVDMVSPEEAYSAARFASDALVAMSEIASRGKVPLLAGGTMLYFRALQEGLDPLPSADPVVRARLDEEAARAGWSALYHRLGSVDPVTAQRLKPGDTQRIQRALEVWEITGKPLSELVGQRSPLNIPVLNVGLMPSDRARLHDLIAQRFDSMLQAGLADELRALRSRYTLNSAMPSMRSVGYRQMWQFLEGELDREEMRYRGIVATRQLAKRQMTWMRSWANLQSLDCWDDSLDRRAEALLGDFLAA